MNHIESLKAAVARDRGTDCQTIYYCTRDIAGWLVDILRDEYPDGEVSVAPEMAPPEQGSGPVFISEADDVSVRFVIT